MNATCRPACWRERTGRADLSCWGKKGKGMIRRLEWDNWGRGIGWEKERKRFKRKRSMDNWREGKGKRLRRNKGGKGNRKAKR